MSNSIDLILKNTKDSNPPTDGIAKIYQNVDATLEVTLINNTSDSIDLTGSEVELQLPLFLKDATGMKISSKPAGFADATYNSKNQTFTLKHSGAGKWDTDSSHALKFTIENIKTDIQPPTTPEMFEVLIGGEIAQKSIALISPPNSNQIILPTDVIDFSLQNKIILVSDPNNPLPDANTLKLTLSNKTAKAIDFDPTLSPNASIAVSFVVGNTNTCFTQEYNTGSTGKGSIKNVKVSGGSPDWGFEQAYNTSGASGGTGTNNALPKMSNPWVLTPNNSTILGGMTSGQSSVTFEFDNIYSFTDIGPTLMYIYFSGFKINSQQAYKDEFIVLPIFKESITPKLSNFTIEPTVIKYDSSGKLNTFITPSWQLDPPPGKTQGDVTLHITVASTNPKNKANHNRQEIDHNENGKPLNLLTLCTWTKDLSNEKGIEIGITATVTDSSVAFFKT